MSTPIAFQSLPLSYPITRRCDGATLNALRELRSEREGMYTCLLVLDKAYLGMITFASNDSSIVIKSLLSAKKDIYSGIGTQLVNVALKCAELSSKTCVEVFSTSDAVGFYYRLGFRIQWEKYRNLDDVSKKAIQEQFDQMVIGKSYGIYFYMFRS